MERITDEVVRIEMPRPDLTPPWKPQSMEPVGCHLYEGEQRILFGTGYGFSADQLVEELRAVGGVDVVVAEHGDPDHFGAIPALQDHFEDLTVGIPSLDANVPGKYYFEFEPDVAFEDGDEYWGLTAVHIPGHTPGNMAFVDESRELLFAGDSVVHSVSEFAAEGPWSGSLAPILSHYNKSATEDARSNITRLTEFAFEKVLLTHGEDVLADGMDELQTLMADLGVD